jgi:hypothetical protein
MTRQEAEDLVADLIHAVTQCEIAEFKRYHLEEVRELRVKVIEGLCHAKAER